MHSTAQSVARTAARLAGCGCLALAFLAGAGALRAQAPAETLPLVPYPRQLTQQGGELHLAATTTIAVTSGSADDAFAARLLAAELSKIDHVSAAVSMGPSGAIVLARADTARGRALLQQADASGSLHAEGEEGYVLLVNAHRAAVVGNSAAGVFYGVETLRQLFHPNAHGGADAPAVAVADWPALAWRGVQIDLSRGPIPTLAAMERDVALLAEFKVNLVVLYFENTFAYQSEPLMAEPGGAMTAADAKALVNFARPYHVTITPEQESFGHLHLALQEEQYQDLVEVPYGSVLSPTVPASLDLIGHMFAELNQAFPGPFFHIGADETSELGQGRSQSLVAAGPGSPGVNLGHLYLDYLTRIAAVLAPYHRRILFWGDIAEAHPELLSSLPPGMIAVAWQYNPETSYNRYIEPFRNAGMETWVSPGVSNWSRIFPDYSAAIPNIEGFIADGRRLGITGTINTTWMDDGESLFDFTWYGLGFGAAAAWEEQPDPQRYDAAYDWTLFRADGHAFAGEIANLTEIQKALKASGLGASDSDHLVWLDPFSVSGQQTYTRLEPQAHQIRLLAESVIADLSQSRAGARRNADLLDPVEFAARRFDFLGEKAIYAHMIATQYAEAQAPGTPRSQVSQMLGRINGMNGWLQDMRDGTTLLRGQYQQLWLAANRPYFLGNILVRYDAELMMWQEQAQRFNAIAAAWRASGSLPALLHPDLAPAAGAPEEGIVPRAIIPHIIH